MNRWQHHTPQSPTLPGSPAPVSASAADREAYLGAAVDLLDNGFQHSRIGWSAAAAQALFLAVSLAAAGLYAMAVAMATVTVMGVRQAWYAHTMVRSASKLRQAFDG